MNPPVLVKKEDGTLVTADGDRRITALLNLGIDCTLCLVYEGLTEVEVAHLSYFLNSLREDLNPIERALHLKAIINKWSLTYIQLQALGYGSKAQISKLIHLLDLPQKTQGKIAKKELNVAHGTALLKAQKPDKVAKLAVEKNWSAKKIVKFIEGLVKKQEGTIEILPEHKDLKGPNTTILEDGSVECIFSVLPSLALSNKNQAYLEFQVAEANRVLVKGGTLTICLETIEDRQFVSQLLNKNKFSFYPITEFIGQGVGPELKVKIKKHINSTTHAEYKAQTGCCSILIFQKLGSSRSVSSDVANESKLSPEEAVAYLQSAWTLDLENALEEVISTIIKMNSFKGDNVLDLFTGNDTVNEVAKKLGRHEIDCSRKDTGSCNTPKDSDQFIESETEGIQEYSKKDLESNQPENEQEERSGEVGLTKAMIYGTDSREEEAVHA